MFIIRILEILSDHEIHTQAPPWTQKRTPVATYGQQVPIANVKSNTQNGKCMKVQLATPGTDASAPRNMSPPRVEHAYGVNRNTLPPSPSHHGTCECPAYAGDPSALAIGTTSPGIKPPEHIFAWSKIRPHWQAKTSSGLTTTPFN